MDGAALCKYFLTMDEPRALLDGHYGPLSDEQREFLLQLQTGYDKAAHWLREWLEGAIPDTEDGIALLAHKINSGLASMIGYGALLQADAAGSLSEPQLDAVTHLVTTGEQVHAYLQDSFDQRLRPPDA